MSWRLAGCGNGCDGKESDVFFVSSPDTVGKCWLSPQLDYLSEISWRKCHNRGESHDGRLVSLLCFCGIRIVWYFAIVCTEALTDTLNGEPVYVVDADGILGATDPDSPMG